MNLADLMEAQEENLSAFHASLSGEPTSEVADEAEASPEASHSTLTADDRAVLSKKAREGDATALQMLAERGEELPSADAGGGGVRARGTSPEVFSAGTYFAAAVSGLTPAAQNRLTRSGRR